MKEPKGINNAQRDWRQLLRNEPEDCLDQWAQQGLRALPNVSVSLNRMARKSSVWGHTAFWIMPIVFMIVAWLPPQEQIPSKNTFASKTPVELPENKVAETKALVDSTKVKTPTKSFSTRHRILNNTTQPLVDPPNPLEINNLMLLPKAKIFSEKNKESLSIRRKSPEFVLHGFHFMRYPMPVILPKDAEKPITGLPARYELAQPDSSSPVSALTYMDFLDKAAKALNEENFSAATVYFKNILSVYPKDQNALFYSGYCMFRLQNFQESERFLKKCYTGIYGNFDEESLWFLALGAERQQQYALAQQRYEKLFANNGFYAEKARQKLENWAETQR